MRDYITPLGGYLVLGALNAGCVALTLWLFRRALAAIARDTSSEG